MEKLFESLQDAEKIIKTVDHMTYITFPLVKDKKILLKILSETKKAILNCINSILHYEYIYKRINLYKSAKTNFKTFSEKCAPKYGITKEEIESLSELFEIIEKHNQSQMEFIKNEQLVILSENLTPKTITIKEIKEYLLVAKNILNKAKAKILR